jgi:hypothetical protein
MNRYVKSMNYLVLEAVERPEWSDGTKDEVSVQMLTTYIASQAVLYRHCTILTP